MSSLATNHPMHATLARLVPMLRLDLASWGRVVSFFLLGVGVMAFAFGFQIALVLLIAAGSFMALTPFAMDHRNRLPLLYGSLPVTRRTVITSHYLVAAGAFVLTSALLGPAALLAHGLYLVNFRSELPTGWLTLAGVSAVVALFLPLVVRFGVKPLVYAYVAGVGIFAAFFSVAQAVNLSLDRPSAWLAANTTTARIALAVTVAIIWVVSYLLSVRWFEAKDF